MTWNDVWLFLAIVCGMIGAGLAFIMIFFIMAKSIDVFYDWFRMLDWSKLKFWKRSKSVKWAVKEVDGKIVVETEVTDHGKLTEEQKKEIDQEVERLRKERIWKIARDQEEQTQKEIKREWAIRDLRNVDATNPEFDDVVIEAVVDEPEKLQQEFWAVQQKIADAMRAAYPRRDFLA